MWGCDTIISWQMTGGGNTVTRGTTGPPAQPAAARSFLSFIYLLRSRAELSWAGLDSGTVGWFPGRCWAGKGFIKAAQYLQRIQSGYPHYPQCDVLGIIPALLRRNRSRQLKVILKHESLAISTEISKKWSDQWPSGGAVPCHWWETNYLI